MNVIRSERNAAILLLVAAALGLLLANLPTGPALLRIQAVHLGIPGVADLSLGHWISDGLLAIFFFVIAVELKHELTTGSLSDRRHAAVPALAALGGVVVPALLYTATAAWAGLGRGWPVPTATDIAFALGVLALVGRALPSRVRVFLLALAVLDDLIAIVIIAVFFTEQIAFLPLAGAILCAVGAGLASRIRARGALRGVVIAGVVLLALATWVFALNSGVHPTLAGVAVGLAVARRPGARAAHRLLPVSNGVVLPLFAFSAAIVVIPAVGLLQLSPAFWGIVAGLAIGKPVGIVVAGLLAARALHRDAAATLPTGDLLAVGVLGGIGFTVSLLMNELAFEALPEIVDEGTLAVLLGSACSIAAAIVVVRSRSRHHTRDAAMPSRNP